MSCAPQTSLHLVRGEDQLAPYLNTYPQHNTKSLNIALQHESPIAGINPPPLFLPNIPTNYNNFLIDNANRATRVKDLANNTAFSQFSIKELLDQMVTGNNRAYTTLETLAERAGCTTVKEYCDKAYAVLPEEDRRKYTSIQGKLVTQDDHISKAREISGYITSIAITAGFSRSTHTKYRF